MSAGLWVVLMQGISAGVLVGAYGTRIEAVEAAEAHARVGSKEPREAWRLDPCDGYHAMVVYHHVSGSPPVVVQHYRSPTNYLRGGGFLATDWEWRNGGPR